MEIDDRFAISLEYTTTDGTPGSVSLSASTFFDCEDFVESEWGCELPWKHLNLIEYLPPGVGQVLTFSLRIHDRNSGQESVLLTQYLGNVVVSLSWKDQAHKPWELETIVDIVHPVSNKCTVARADVCRSKLEITLFWEIPEDLY